MISRRARTAVLGFAAALLSPTLSHAQTVTAVYDDVKDVFVQLVELRAAEDATRFVERASAGLGFYLQPSLEHVRRSQWAALETSLRDDFADLGADYVLWALENSDDPTLRSATEERAAYRTFLDCFEPPGLNEPQVRNLCAPLHKLRESVPRSTLRYRDCEAVRPLPVKGHELSCEIAELVHAALVQDADEAHLYAVRALSAIGSFASPSFRRSASDTAQAKGPRVHAPVRALLQDVLDLNAGSDSVPKSWLIDAPPSQSLHDALRDCVPGSEGRGRTDEDLVRTLLAQPPNSGDHVSAALVCVNARFPIPVRVRAGKNAAAPEIHNAMLELEKLPPEARTLDALMRVAPAGTDAIDLLGFHCAAPGGECEPDEASPRGATTDPPLKQLHFADLLKLALLLDDLSHKILPASPTGERFECSGTCPYDVIDLAADFAALREQQPASGSARTLSDVANEFGHGLRIIKARIDVCNQEPNSAPCTAQTADDSIVLHLARYLLPTPDRVEARSDVQEIVHDALEGRRAEIATRALRGAFDELFETGAAGRIDRLFADLIVTVAQFELSDPSNDGRAVSRDALRASAIRLVDGLASQTGYQATGFTLRPIVSLRASWDQGYHNEHGSNGVRYVASVDWPAVRVRLSDVAVAQFSLFDVLAPLDEIASREVPSESANFQYDAQQFLILDAVRPRLNLLLGYPTLSHNLVVSTGIAFRMITQRQVVEGTTTYRRYRTTFGAKQDLADALELNLGISYVF